MSVRPCSILVVHGVGHCLLVIDTCMVRHPQDTCVEHQALVSSFTQLNILDGQAVVKDAAGQTIWPEQLWCD